MLTPLKDTCRMLDDCLDALAVASLSIFLPLSNLPSSRKAEQGFMCTSLRVTYFDRFSNLHHSCAVSSYKSNLAVKI